MTPLTSLEKQTVCETRDRSMGEIDRSKRLRLIDSLELAATRVLKTAIAQGSINQDDAALNVLAVVLEQLEKLQPKGQEMPQYQSTPEPIAEVNPAESEPAKSNLDREEVRER